MGVKLNKYSNVSLHTKRNFDYCLSVPMDVKKCYICATTLTSPTDTCHIRKLSFL